MRAANLGNDRRQRQVMRRLASANAVLFSPSRDIQVTYKVSAPLANSDVTGTSNFISQLGGYTDAAFPDVTVNGKVAHLERLRNNNHDLNQPVDWEAGCHCRLVRSNCSFPLHYDQYFHGSADPSFAPLWNLTKYSSDEIVEDWWQCAPTVSRSSNFQSPPPLQFTVSGEKLANLSDGYYLVLSTCSYNATILPASTWFDDLSPQASDSRYSIELPTLWTRPAHSYIKVDTAVPKTTIRPARGGKVTNSTIYRCARVSSTTLHVFSRLAVH